MRTITLGLFILIICSINDRLVAAEKIASKDNQVSSGIVINDSLKKLMNTEGVEPIYSDCQSRFSQESDNRAEKEINCLWEGVKRNPKVKKAVQEAYAQELKTSQGTTGARSPASASVVPLTARTTNVSTDYQSDPAVIALTEFYGKKLDTILNPEVALTKEERKKNTILSVNHSKFIRLYKSELGKTIISAFTSYCLDADPELDKCSCSPAELQACTEVDKEKCSCNGCSIENDKTKREAQRQKNIESLKHAKLNTESDESKKWTHCISTATNACKRESADLLNETPKTETTRRSCLLMDFVKSARKNIIAADEQITFYDDMAKNQTTQIAANMKEITDLKIASSDALLEMTSTDVKTALEKPIKAKLQDLEGCYKDNVIVNVDACKKYLNTNTKDNEAALAELGMRQIAQESILEEELGSDQRVRDYLKEEGHSGDQIEKMTADRASIDEVKGQILKRYANQKAVIIKEMAARIADKTAVVDGAITQQNDISKMEKIKTELESRSADLQNLVYFNNIVSSYLAIEDTSKNTTTRNTASLFAEANSLEKDQADELKKQIERAQLKDQKGAGDTINLEVKDINSSFLNYETKK